MDRRHEVLAATGFCLLGVGIAAASLPASFAFEPPGSDGAGADGSSLLALLIALVYLLAELLGIPLPDEMGAPTGEGGLLALVLDVVRAVAPYLPAAIAVLAVVAVALLARALWTSRAMVALTLAPSRPAAGWWGDRSTETGTGTDPDRRREWPPERPDDRIGEMWVALVERAGVDAPETKTPAEIARAAVDDGLDERPVEQLTTAFVETRYGPAEPTDERRRQATTALDELDA